MDLVAWSCQTEWDLLHKAQHPTQLGSNTRQVLACRTPPASLPLPLGCTWNNGSSPEYAGFHIHTSCSYCFLLDICCWPTTGYWSNWVSGLAICPIHHTGLLQSHSPVYQFDVWVALHQHKAAPVPQQGGERWVGDTALDGAVAAIVAWCVQVLGHRPAEWGREQHKNQFLFFTDFSTSNPTHPMTGMSALFLHSSQFLSTSPACACWWKPHSLSTQGSCSPPCIISVSLYAMYGYYLHSSATRTSLSKEMLLEEMFASSRWKCVGQL